MTKITVKLNDGSAVELDNVLKVEMSSNGIGFCLLPSEWVDTYLRKHEIRKKKENLELQDLIENLPGDFWQISFTPADDYYDDWHNDYFTVTKGNESDIVNSGDLVDALKALVEFEND